jgi:hypothetical protein
MQNAGCILSAYPLSFLQLWVQSWKLSAALTKKDHCLLKLMAGSVAGILITQTKKAKKNSFILILILKKLFRIHAPTLKKTFYKPPFGPA